MLSVASSTSALRRQVYQLTVAASVPTCCVRRHVCLPAQCGGICAAGALRRRHVCQRTRAAGGICASALWRHVC